MNKFDRALAEQLGFGPAEQAGPRGVDRDGPRRNIADDHQVARQRPDAVPFARAVAYLAGQQAILPAQRGFGGLALGDVLGHANEPGAFAVAEEALPARRHPSGGAVPPLQPIFGGEDAGAALCHGCPQRRLHACPVDRVDTGHEAFVGGASFLGVADPPDHFVLVGRIVPSAEPGGRRRGGDEARFPAAWLRRAGVDDVRGLRPGRGPPSPAAAADSASTRSRLRPA